MRRRRRHVCGVGVGEVAQQREVQVRIAIGRGTALRGRRGASSTRASESMIAGTTTIVRSLGECRRENRAWAAAAARTCDGDHQVDQADGELADRQQDHQRDQHDACRAGARGGGRTRAGWRRRARSRRQSCRDSRWPDAGRRTARTARGASGDSRARARTRSGRAKSGSSRRDGGDRLRIVRAARRGQCDARRRDVRLRTRRRVASCSTEWR